jgi:hypothetical protein
VVCDTSFLIRLVEAPLEGLEEVEVEVGRLEWVVPCQVVAELRALASARRGRRALWAARALEFASRLGRVELPPGPVDEGLVGYAREARVYVATLDGELVRRLRGEGLPVVTLRGGRLVVEGALRPKGS